MKKVLALVLAVMMLSTLAFATTTANPNDDKYVVDEENSVYFGGRYAPGTTLYVYRNMDTIADSGDWVTSSSDVTFPNGAGWNALVNSNNYYITNQRWYEGKDLLSGIEFNDKLNQVEIKLKEDFTLKQRKTLRGTFTLKGKGKGGTAWVDGKKVSAKPVNVKVTLEITIGNWKQEVAINVDNDTVLGTGGNAADLDPNEPIKTPATARTLYTNDVMNNAVQVFTDGSYGTVVLNCADDEDTEVTFRAYKNDEAFLFNNTSANNDLLKAYADVDAEISFLNFVANPTLNSTATVRFYKDEDSHVYVMKDGKLTSEVKWDADEDCFILKTRTLGNYVFSDKALKIDAPTAADTNPDTGANDVVGIATALAAVALVSAAAVSLKK